MANIHQINPDADYISSHYALATNAAACKGLAKVLASNFGPKGTLKMIVSGAGAIKITKDGSVLLKDMALKHPTGQLVARTATAQDDITGDGTTSVVLLTAAILSEAERAVADGLHPRVLVDGIEEARKELIKFLDTYKVAFASKSSSLDRAKLVEVAQTSLRTKVHRELADALTEIVVDAVTTIRKDDKPVDLHMVEIMQMTHQSDVDTRLVKGLVLDHGARHPGMSRRSNNCFILTCNVSLEFEKTEVNSGFFYQSQEERDSMVAAERHAVDVKVAQIVEFKERMCSGDKKDHSFVIINQKGIDPVSLDQLQRAGIVAIRRAKRRNMERLPLACGGYAVNSVQDLHPDCLGFAETVYEHTLGEDVYTFVEGVAHPFSCTILIKGPNKHTIDQIKDAVRDGLRACNNAILDEALVPGAGAFEAAAHLHLMKVKQDVEIRYKAGVLAFANALLELPKILAGNAGKERQQTVFQLLEDTQKAGSKGVVGLDLDAGGVLDPRAEGIWDNVRVKKQVMSLSSLIANKLLLVDEIIRAGRSMGGGQ